MSKYIVYNTKNMKEGETPQGQSEEESLYPQLHGAILATFPENQPSSAELEEMNFVIHEQDKKFQYQTRNKRVIKCQRKGIKYVATNFQQNVSDRNQACDYYLGVMPSKASKHENSVYVIPIQEPFQFTQEIEGFKEKYGVAEDNEAIKNMSYYSKKVLIS